MSLINDDLDPQSMRPDDVVLTCQRRHKLAQDAEAASRDERIDDIRFLRLREQWPAYAVQGRNIPGRERPMLVVNRLLQFRNQVINEIRQNTPNIVVRPVDDQADIKTAEIFEGIIRHIMAISGGDAAIDTAAEWQVDTGLGYIAVEPDWIDGDSWDQDLYIRRCEDPLKWWLDPSSREVDGSDAEWAIYALDMPKSDFMAQYPDAEPNQFDLLDYSSSGGWVSKDTIRVAKYFWLQKQAVKAKHPATGKTVVRYKRRCFCSIIAGSTELDRTEIMFKGEAYIPVVPVYGLDTVIEGERHVEGLIRNGKDAQRMLNYAKSASAEHVALVTKAPWIGTAEQFEGRPEWDDPNTPYAKMVYNPVSHMGQPLPPPTRGQPPTPNTAWVQIEQQAIQDMQAALGIYDAALSANPNEQSGKALLSLQRQASQGTFHYSDNLGRSIKHLARILVGMIPCYYDAPRVARIIGADGNQDHAVLDPSMPQAANQMQDPHTGAIKTIYNLGVGRYDVVCDVGPSYATKRQEAADNMLQALTTPLGHGIAATAGDLVIKQFDWPMADELAERYKRSLPPQVTADDNGQDPQLMQAQQQMQQMQQQMQQMDQIIQQLKMEHDIKRAELQIKQYQAETARMTASKTEGAPDPVEYSKARVQTELEERRIALEKYKIDLDYQLRLMQLGLDQQQARANEQTVEQEEEADAKQFADIGDETTKEE